MARRASSKALFVSPLISMHGHLLEQPASLLLFISILSRSSENQQAKPRRDLVQAVLIYPIPLISAP